MKREAQARLVEAILPLHLPSRWNPGIDVGPVAPKFQKCQFL